MGRDFVAQANAHPELWGAVKRHNQMQKRQRQKRVRRAADLYFGGMTNTAELALVVGVHRETVRCYIREAKAQLEEQGMCPKCSGTGRVVSI